MRISKKHEWEFMRLKTLNLCIGNSVYADTAWEDQGVTMDDECRRASGTGEESMLARGAAALLSSRALQQH